MRGDAPTHGRRFVSAQAGGAVLLAAMLTGHASLLAHSAYRHGPVVSEVGHLPAGVSHWQFGRFDLYRVNPPLVRMIAALPVMAAAAHTDWSSYSTDPLTRSETSVGLNFVKANGSRTFWLYTLGRWACIPFSLLGAWICFRWARELYGLPSGLMAMALWCFCPNILGNGALLMPDVPAAALAAAACYTFWRWLRQPTWMQTILAGVVLGAAELTKTTLVVFYPLWPVLWIVYRLAERRNMSARDWLREALMLVARLLLGLYIVNLGYGFEGSFQRLADYRFQSHTLSGAEAADRQFPPGNRFADSWLGRLPVPLPKNYMQGIDTQKVDFERGMRSYLRGQWSDRGWWYFYFYALAMKVPLGTWALVILATALSCFPRYRVACWRDELLVLAPIAVVLALVSSQTGFSIHFRYVLPIFPFLFIYASKAAIVFNNPSPSQGEGRETIAQLRPADTLRTTTAATSHPAEAPAAESFMPSPTARRALQFLVASSLTWSIASSLWYYPHSLSYFNELVGGPRRGHEHLLDSSIAWGQDLLYLKAWYDAHPQARPFYLATGGLVDPGLAGIEFDVPEPLATAPPSEAGQGDGARLTTFSPGWYAIDVNHLHDSRQALVNGRGGRTSNTARGLNLGGFRSLRPAARVGYSIYIYRVEPKPTAAP